MIFKPNMIVVLTHGRLAGKKGVVVGQLNENTIVVAGINRTPVPSQDFMPKWQKVKNEKFLTFVKKVNVNHVIATRYKADVADDSMKPADMLADLNAKRQANVEMNKLLRAAYDANRSRFLFTELKF